MGRWLMKGRYLEGNGCDRFEGNIPRIRLEKQKKLGKIIPVQGVEVLRVARG
jgi:hypothetical protein